MDGMTGSKGRIMVVDDDPDILKIVGTILSMSGFSVSSASNGKQALEMLRVSRPDLVILDLKMPVMDGYQTCQELQGDPNLASLPVIFMSAYMNQAPLDSLGGQVVDRIEKPFDPRNLVSRVRRHLPA
jgi:putative two-component system response regulator